MKKLFDYLKDMEELIVRRILCLLHQRGFSDTDKILKLLGRKNKYSPPYINSEFKKELDEKKTLLFKGTNYHPILMLLAFFKMNEFDEHCLALSILTYTDSRYRSIIPYLQISGTSYFTLQTAMDIFCGEYNLENKLAYILEMDKKTGPFLFEKYDEADINQKPLILQRQIIEFLFSETERKSDNYKVFTPDNCLNNIIFGQGIQKSLIETLKLNGCYNKIIYFYGNEDFGKWFQIKYAAKKLNRTAVMYKCTDYNEEEIYEVFTESMLNMAILYISGYTSFSEKEIKSMIGLYEKYCCNIFPLILGCETKIAGVQKNLTPFFEIEMKQPDIDEKESFWAYMLGQDLGKNGIFGKEFAARFPFDCKKISDAVYEARQKALVENNGSLTKDILESCCKNYSLQNIKKYASFIPIHFVWEDLILDKNGKRQIRQACNQIKFYSTVYEKWNFKIPYGRGVRVLFEGPPGTGKTMAAQIVARETGYELYKIDLSGILSKYIGETEKQLKSVFEEAKGQNILLFFDEMDALFGQRSAIKSSNDRYGNMETAFLLQQIEEYDGAIVFATNFLKNVDTAFLRRIQFIIRFSIPDKGERIKIWKNMFPKEAPVDDDIDFEYLSGQFELSGGNIKNIVISAAFSAAADGQPINMKYIINAVCDEIIKQGKVILKEDLGKYSFLWEEYKCINL